MKFIQWLSLILLTASLFLLWRIREVLLLGFAAVVIATVLNHVIKKLQRWTRGRRAAMLILLGAISLLFTVGFSLIVPPFIDQLDQLISLIPASISQLRLWFEGMEERVPIAWLDKVQGINRFLSYLQTLNINLMMGRFFLWFSNTLSITLKVLLVIILTIMLLVDPSPYQQAFVHAFPASVRPRVREVMEACEGSIANWFFGILFNVSVIAIFSSLGLWLLQVPLPLANGLLAGFLAFIPNLGPVLSVLPPVAIALLIGPWKAVSVLLLYIVIQQIESNILTPIVMQKQVSLLPAVTLLSQLIFTVLFGFLGLLLALPLVLITKTWLQEFWVKPILDTH